MLFCSSIRFYHFVWLSKKKKITIHIAFLKWHKNSWLTIYVSPLYTFWLCKYSLVSSTAACSQIESPLCIQALLSEGLHNLALMCPIQALLQLANSSSSSKNVKLLKKKKRGKQKKEKRAPVEMLCYDMSYCLSWSNPSMRTPANCIEINLKDWLSLKTLWKH